MPERMSEDMPDRMPEDLPERMSEDMPDRMSDRMPEDMPDRMPEDLPERMPEDMPEDMPEHLPEDMPDRMPDRMPEDLPVRKCINVMVGITRSKVIFFALAPRSGFRAANSDVVARSSIVICSSVSADCNAMAASRLLGAAAACVILLSFAAGHRKSHWNGCASRLHW